MVRTRAGAKPFLSPTETVPKQKGALMVRALGLCRYLASLLFTFFLAATVRIDFGIYGSL